MLLQGALCAERRGGNSRIHDGRAHAAASAPAAARAIARHARSAGPQGPSTAARLPPENFLVWPTTIATSVGALDAGAGAGACCVGDTPGITTDAASTTAGARAVACTAALSLAWNASDATTAARDDSSAGLSMLTAMYKIGRAHV